METGEKTLVRPPGSRKRRATGQTSGGSDCCCASQQSNDEGCLGASPDDGPPEPGQDPDLSWLESSLDLETDLDLEADLGLESDLDLFWIGMASDDDTSRVRSCL